MALAVQIYDYLPINVTFYSELNYSIIETLISLKSLGKLEEMLIKR